MRLQHLFPLAEDLDHSRRLLFHATTSLRAARILADDELRAMTIDTAPVMCARTGISLTRAYAFAQQFKGARRGVIFVIDASRMRTAPVDYWYAGDGRRRAGDDEMEEFAVADIKPLSRYLVSINSQMTFDAWLERVREHVASPDFEFMTPDPQTRARLIRDAENGFPSVARLWNVWSPIVGIVSRDNR